MIELTITVAIVGILAATAIPMYSDFTVRARWSDVIQRLAPVKMALAECLQAHPDDPNTCGDTAVLMGANGEPAWIGAMPSFDPYGGTVATIVAVPTPSIRVVSSNAMLRNCAIQLVASPSASAVSWRGLTESGCSRGQTGLPN